MQFSEAMQTEADSIYDTFILFILAITFFFKQGSYLEKTGKLKSKRKLLGSDSSSDERKGAEARIENSISGIKKLGCVKAIRTLFPYILVILCVKGSYFFDREKSKNFPVDPKLDEWKKFV